MALLNPSKCLFLLCDVQERFRDMIFGMAAVIHVAKRMSLASKILDIPLIVTEQNPRVLGATCKEIDLANSNLKGGMAFPKSNFSMCINEVNELMQRDFPHVDTVVLFGIEAHVCVLQTALELREKGMKVHVLCDGTSSSTALHRYTAFERMKQENVKMETSESALFQLMRTHQHPQFKQISQLVKDKIPEGAFN